jgi:HD-GYP domain-containing protein (c-di-GMP phosphodiesterase class II)
MPIGQFSSPVPAWHALRALSVGLDLAMGRRPGHAQATARLSLTLGEHLGLPPADREALVLAALLKDAG